jgi:hypothetical protein
MLRFCEILLFLSFLSLTFALPHEQRGIIGAKLEGSCTNHHLPTEEQYTIGWKSFCEKYRPSEISERDALDATYNLTAYDGKIIQWIYRIQDVHDDKDILGNQVTWDTLPYDPAKCSFYFDKILSDPESGGLGKSYCVVDGTGGDWFGGGDGGRERMSGEGVVLVMGGKEEPNMSKQEKGNGKGYLRYLSRKRN